MTIFFVCKFSRASCGVDYKRRNNKQVVYLDNDHDVRLFISGKNVTTLEIIDKFKWKEKETNDFLYLITNFTSKRN